MRRSHVIYTQKIPCKKNYNIEKRPRRRSLAFDKHEVTARGKRWLPSRATVRAKVA
jgi:hypothetical protein